MEKLTPQQRAYVKKRSKIKTPNIAELDDELNIVPFLDIVINLIMFLLMVTSTIAFYTQLESSLPEYGGPGGPRPQDDRPRLDLSVFVTEDGIIVTGENGKLLPGCRSASGGDVLTIPTVNAQQDWDALSECVATVKAAADEANMNYTNSDGEAQITVTADAEISYQDLLWTMDSVREEFPAILISAGIR